MPGTAAPERTAVLVARAWLHGDPPALVARITYTVDVTEPDRVTVAASGADEIVDAIRRWIDELATLAAARDGPVTQA
jgi:hypothetical protein